MITSLIFVYTLIDHISVTSRPSDSTNCSSVCTLARALKRNNANDKGRFLLIFFVTILLKQFEPHKKTRRQQGEFGNRHKHFGPQCNLQFLLIHLKVACTEKTTKASRQESAASTETPPEYYSLSCAGLSDVFFRVYVEKLYRQPYAIE